MNSVPPEQPEVRTIQVELYLRVENNNNYVRGKSRSREEIEQQVLSRYGMQKRSPDSWTYLLTIPYTTDEELEAIIADLFQEAEHIADLRNGFTVGISRKSAVKRAVGDAPQGLPWKAHRGRHPAMTGRFGS